MLSTKDKMQVAINEMYKADKKLEVPVGACIFKNDKLIAKAHNKKKANKMHFCTQKSSPLTKLAKGSKVGAWTSAKCMSLLNLVLCVQVQ